MGVQSPRRSKKRAPNNVLQKDLDNTTRKFPTSSNPEVPSGLKCMYSNVDQLLNKVEDLKTLISGNEPDIMLLTEIIPKAQRNEIHEAQLNVPGYEKFVNFKFSDQQLGASGKRGVAIYAKEELDTEEIKLNTDYADHLWVEVTLRNKDILLSGCVSYYTGDMRNHLKGRAP